MPVLPCKELPVDTRLVRPNISVFFQQELHSNSNCVRTTIRKLQVCSEIDVWFRFMFLKKKSDFGEKIIDPPSPHRYTITPPSDFEERHEERKLYYSVLATNTRITESPVLPE